SYDKGKNLAILKIRSWDSPEPLNEMRMPDIREAMTVHIFGFNARTRRFSSSRKNPQVSITPGTVSSIRRDRNGTLAHIKISGAINIGNSGGPVVDDNGNMLGIAVARSSGSTGGIVIPVRSLTGLLKGRIDKSKVVEVSNARGEATVTINLHVTDPMKKMETLGVAMIPGEAMTGSLKPGEDGSIPQIGKSLKDYIKCKWDRPKARISFILKGEPGTIKKYYYQVGYAGADNRVRFMRPAPFELTFMEKSVAIAKNESGGSSVSIAMPELKEPKVIKAPGSITNCCAAGGGSYLVAFFKKLRKLGIFSFAEQKFITYISLQSSEILYSAGRSKIVVIDTARNLITRYSLLTGNRELTQQVPVTGTVLGAIMGRNSNGPLLVQWTSNSRSSYGASFDLIDIDNMQKINFPFNRRNYSSYRDALRFRASSDGSTITFWSYKRSWGDMFCMLFYEDSVEIKRNDSRSSGPI
ncbi:MAG: serine protease, partial [bacterium]|nr:serine protease [bacterium]